MQENADEATLHPAPKIFKEDCRIDWHREGRRIIDFIRGLSPYPAAWTGMFRDGSDEMQTAKIFAATFEEAAHGASCGTVESDGRTFIRVACSDGWIVLGELQIAGKNASRCASSCWAGATCCNTVSNRGAGKTRSRSGIPEADCILLASRKRPQHPEFPDFSYLCPVNRTKPHQNP